MDENRTRAGAIFGGLLIILGLIFMAGQFFRIYFGDALWPLIIIGVGGLFFLAMILSGPSSGGLAIPGSIIVTVGLILFVQNLFDLFDTWAYSWALIVASVGVGRIIQGYWSRSEGARRGGWGLVRLGLVLFLIFGTFFELLIYRRGTAAGILWPALLILAGIGVVVYSLVKKSPPAQSA